MSAIMHGLDHWCFVCQAIRCAVTELSNSHPKEIYTCIRATFNIVHAGRMHRWLVPRV